MILFGIATCDTCRKALKELEAAGHTVAFRDVRSAPLSAGECAAFLDDFGDSLINRRSTTWRSIDDAERAASPAALIAAHPTLMKRPVVEDGGRRTLGWDAAVRTSWGI